MKSIYKTENGNSTSTYLFNDQLMLHGIPKLTFRNVRNPEKPTPPHTHTNFEIHFCQKGKVQYQQGNMTYRVPSGYVYIAKPGILHGSVACTTVLKYYLMEVDSSAASHSFLGHSRAVSENLCTLFFHINQPCFFAGNKITRLFEQIIKVYESEPPRAVLKLQNLFTTVILYLVDQSDSNKHPELSEEIRAAIHYIHSNLYEEIPIAGLAAQTGLSISSFRQRFRKETGLPPGEFIIREKIREAELILMQDNSIRISRLAFELGFSSSQHFSSMFRKYTGRAPKEIKKYS